MTLKLNGSSSGSVSLDAPASGGDPVYKLPGADGTAGQVLQTDGSGNLSWVTPGISHATIFRQNTTTAISATTWTDVTGNWEVSDSSHNGTLGTAVSQSSGVFTFPQTGIWKADCQWTWTENGVLSYGISELRATVDNGSNWNASAKAYTDITNAGVQQYTTGSFSTLLDVTNTTNVKVKMTLYASHACEYVGNTDNDVTCIIFTRLGDT